MSVADKPLSKESLFARRRSAEERGDWRMARVYTEALSEMGAFVSDEEGASLKQMADQKRRNSAKRKARKEKG